MIVYAAAALFASGLLLAFFTLYAFERQVRGERMLRRERVRTALRRLIAAALAGGVGMGLLGLSAFVWGRAGPPGMAAFAWAGVFAVCAVLGWPAILLLAFLGRVNALRRILPEKD